MKCPVWDIRCDYERVYNITYVTTYNIVKHVCTVWECTNTWTHAIITDACMWATYMSTNTSTNTMLHTRTYACTHARTHAHARTHTHTHTHTHVRVHTRVLRTHKRSTRTLYITQSSHYNGYRISDIFPTGENQYSALHTKAITKILMNLHVQFTKILPKLVIKFHLPLP